MIRRPDIFAVVLIGALFAFGCADLNKNSKVEKKDSDPAAEKAAVAPAPRINPMTHIAAGQMLEKQGDLNGAIEQYEKAVAADPKNSTGYNRLGIVYQKLGRFADAEQMFAQGIAVHPGSASLHNNLGYTFLMENKLAEAEQSFRNSLAVSPQYQRARMNLGIVLVHAGKLDDAASEFGQATTPDIAYFNVAVTCLKLGDYNNTEKWLKQALAVNPNCPGARQQLDKLVMLGKVHPLNHPDHPRPTPLAGDARKDAGNAP